MSSSSSAYSIRMFQQTMTSAEYLESPVVPTGFIWLVNWITFAMLGETAGYLNIWMPAMPGVGPVTIARTFELYSIHGTNDSQTHQVLNAGECIGVQTASAASDVCVLISGYQLSTT